VSTLLVETLRISLSQEFSITDEDRHQIGAFIPYIYMHNAPAGTFIFSVKNSANVTIFSKSFTSIDIKASLNTSLDYAHVFHPIIPTDPIQLEKGNYIFTLSSSGYTNSSSSFLGWIRQYESLNNILDYEPTDDGQNPLATRLKVYERGIK
jgi:hypothetical protein